MKFTLAIAPLMAALTMAAPATEQRAIDPITKLIGSNGLTKAGQDLVAELFKGGDAVLNLPGDAINKLLSGQPDQALQAIIQGATGTIGSLPGDAAKIIGDLTGAK